jgi:AraC-like DNA-binding protein
MFYAGDSVKSSRSSKLSPDPLSDILSVLALESARCTRLEAGGRWALSFPQRQRLKFVAVLEGAVWIALPDGRCQRVAAGDAFLLTNTPFVVASALDVQPQDGMALFRAPDPNVVRLGGVETIMLGGGFVFDDDNAQLVIDALPTFLNISATQPAAAVLRDTLKILDREMEDKRMGSSIVAKRLADILLIQALRAFVDEHGSNATGWLGALSDARVGAALRLIHGNIRHAWTVSELADAVAMSRSAFAHRFKSMVAMGPLEYCRRWRMQLARQYLRQQSNSVAAIAAQLGYSSESAFGNAYKREFGQPPSQHNGDYRRKTDGSSGRKSLGTARTP